MLGKKKLPWMIKSPCATRKPCAPGLTGVSCKYININIVSLPTPPTKRNTPLPGEAVCSACQQLKDGESKSKKKETDIYLGVFLKQKMLTSPQSFINCSVQMCQRGKGLLGRLRERREERRGNTLLSGSGPQLLGATQKACWGPQREVPITGLPGPGVPGSENSEKGQEFTFCKSPLPLRGSQTTPTNGWTLIKPYS